MCEEQLSRSVSRLTADGRALTPGLLTQVIEEMADVYGFVAKAVGATWKS